MKIFTLAFAFFVGLINAAHAQDNDSITLDAFSVLMASGRVIETGTDRHTFAGEMHGTYFIDVGEGPIPAGEMICVGTLDAVESTGSQEIAADCRLQANDGSVSYGDFECIGYRLVGCTGPFKLVGGDGRLSGIVGEGQILLRRYETELVLLGEGEVQELAFGIASWKNLKLRKAE